MINMILTQLKDFADQHGQEILTSVTRAAMSALVIETAKALELDLTPSPAGAQQEPRTEEDILYTLLSDDPQHIDDLHYKSHIPVGKLAGLLLNLEMQGKAQQYAGQRFARAA